MIEHKPAQGGIIEPARTLPVDGQYEVVVVGGGMAGIGAGIAAARDGWKTLIIEDTSGLGGLVTMGLVAIPLDFPSGIGAEMFKQLWAVDGLWHRNSDPEKHKLVLDRMVRGSGCEILFVTKVVEAIVKDGIIKGVVVESKSGRQAILAQRVVDCSGDADVAYHAGCECKVGRASDGLTQACSLEFRLGGVDWDVYNKSELKATDSRWYRTIEEALANGDLPYEIDNHLNWMTHIPGRPEHEGVDEVSICMAHSRNCHPLDNRDLTRMYLEGREQADILWRFIRKRIPGFERCWLIDTGSLLGVRDSRRVTGEYVLTGWDLASYARFDDVICISGHSYDVHNPDGPGNIKWIKAVVDGETRYIVRRPGDAQATSWPPPGGREVLGDYMGRRGADIEFPNPPTYDIPYRSLVPLGIENLLVAGRCLSADFEAQSGARLILACLTMGEAAGTATSISLKRNIRPRQVDRIELQKTLLANGVNLGQEHRTIPGITD